MLRLLAQLSQLGQCFYNFWWWVKGKIESFQGRDFENRL
jgi:hypothetical protein